MALRILVLGSVNRWGMSSSRGLQNYSAPTTNGLWLLGTGFKFVGTKYHQPGMSPVPVFCLE